MYHVLGILRVAAARRLREHLEEPDWEHARLDVHAQVLERQVHLEEPRVPPASECTKLLVVELVAKRRTLGVAVALDLVPVAALLLPIIIGVGLDNRHAV